jgi:hypothetical protein
MIANLINPSGDNVQQMRAIRNRLLNESDWTQLPDAVCDREAWIEYRQALRDFPNTWMESETAEFPPSPLESE